MNKSLRYKIGLAAIAVLCAIAIWPTVAKAGYVIRLSAENIFPFEQSTFAIPTAGGGGGGSIYTKAVYVPRSSNVLYITMSTTGDTHQGAGEAFACLVDGKPCISSGIGAGEAPSGWIVLGKHYNYDVTYNGGESGGDGGGGSGDMHDNSIYYTWCMRVSPNTTHTVNLRQAVWSIDDPTNSRNAVVYIEGGQYYIDADFQAAGCAAGTP